MDSEYTEEEIMTRPQRPPTNEIGFTVKRPFSSIGFHCLDVSGALSEVGYSKTEIASIA